MSIESVMLSNYLILCYPLLLPSVFSLESALGIRWPKYWSFSFRICASSEYSGLISFRIDWFYLAVQGTLKSLFQHHNSKALILWRSAFFLVQLSRLYAAVACGPMEHRIVGPGPYRATRLVSVCAGVWAKRVPGLRADR